MTNGEEQQNKKQKTEENLAYAIDFDYSYNYDNSYEQELSEFQSVSAPQFEFYQPAFDSSRPYICDRPECDGKNYKKLNGLISHFYSTHSIINNQDIKPYKCGSPGCGKDYRNTNGLAYHLENTHNQPGINTDFEREPGTFYPNGDILSNPPITTPGRQTPSPMSMLSNASYNAAINEQPAKIYPCPFFGCGKVYKNSNGLSYHLQKGKLTGHKTETPPTPNDDVAFKCAVCLVDYLDYNMLMDHMNKTHASEGAFEVQGKQSEFSEIAEQPEFFQQEVGHDEFQGQPEEIAELA